MSKFDIFNTLPDAAPPAPSNKYTAFDSMPDADVDHSPWAFNVTDPTTGQTHANYLPRGVSQTLFSQTGNLLDFFGADDTADTLRNTAQQSFGWSPSENADWESVKEDNIGAWETTKRGAMFALEQTPTSLGHMAFMAPGLVGGALPAIVGSTPQAIAELERIADQRAQNEGSFEDPTLGQYAAAAPSALANVAMDRFTARIPFVKGASPGRAVAGLGAEVVGEGIQGGLEEAVTHIGTQSQGKMDIGDAALSEAVGGMGQATGQTSINYMWGNTGPSATANTFGVLTVWIPHYANTANFKQALCSWAGENASMTDYRWAVGLTAGLWSDTSAIDQITLFDISAADFVQYSTFTLYGVTGA